MDLISRIRPGCRAGIRAVKFVHSVSLEELLWYIQEPAEL